MQGCRRKNKIAALAHATYENPVWVELDRGVIPENEIIDEMVKVAPQYEADISNISCHWLGRSDSFSFFIIVSLWEVRWLWKNRKIFLKRVDIYDILKNRRIVI